MTDSQLENNRLKEVGLNTKLSVASRLPKGTMRCFIIGFLFFLSSCSTFQKQLNSNWTKKEVRSGIHLYYRHFPSLFNAPQYVNVLDIDLRDTSLKLEIAFSDSLLIKTSDFGRSNKAIAGVNGNFFNTHKGGSVCFLKINNHVINYTAYDLNGTLFLPWLDTAALAITDKKIAIIIKPPILGWEQRLDDYPTIIASGPLLVYHHKIVPQQAHRFNDTRYSRTGIGFTKGHHLLFVTVDGNTKESSGVTIAEFARIFKALKCTSALNFDGGGSTTMWINGEPENGVISHPTDNKIFDHKGERKVADAILITGH
ncbi:MAG: phosphodiester glycosidase family protein [Ginsengibacter sp.]